MLRKLFTIKNHGCVVQSDKLILLMKSFAHFIPVVRTSVSLHAGDCKNFYLHESEPFCNLFKQHYFEENLSILDFFRQGSLTTTTNKNLARRLQCRKHLVSLFLLSLCAGFLHC